MDSPIAIVGIGMRLPGGCHDTSSYWDLLVNKRDARKPIPPERFNIDGFAGSVSVKDGYFLDQPIDCFDAGFFSMSQAEVERLDPQQRLLLEVVYEAFENAGETNWRGKDIAVYAGSFGADWAQMQGKDVQDGGVYAFTGHDDFVLANRVSYEFDLRGPSMTIRVGCSSGLVALHLACEALQRGDCSGAMVGAANLLLTPENFMALGNVGVLSPDASSKSFDASANGYARAEAVNAVYIKRVDDAIRDGNPIRAIIRGTAVNSDGKTRGLFNPNPDAHTALIRRAYAKAGILNPDETAVVECHGTGTTAGDPLELAAVSRVLGGKKTTYIGSVKPNVGHAEAAAGLNSLIKAVLALERKIIPPNIKFETPNPRILFSESRLTVPTEVVPWPWDQLQRISVNSFGLGGANAHVIVDAASSTSESNGILSAKSARSEESEQRLLVFSAHSEVSLQKIISNYSEFIERGSFHLSNLAYTLSVKRHHWNVRSFCVSNGKTLQAVPTVKTPKFKGLLFIFTGQGAQWQGMGRELLRDFSTFGEDIRKMDLWLAESSHPPSWKIEELLRDSGDINSAEFAQPICTALQIALVNLLRQWHILPTGVVGHSSGEIAAAYAAGALGMKEALLISYYRGIATSELRRPGAMGALGLGRHDLKNLLVGNAVLACENSRSSVTISGDLDDVEASLDRVSQMRPEVLARKLKVDRAYHSDHMRTAVKRYEDLIASIQPRHGKLSIPFFSSVTGHRTNDATSLSPSYWASNMRSPVLFLSAVESALRREDEFSIALEIGPHSTLSGPFRQICKDMEQKIQYINTLTRGADCTTTILTALGQLYCQGLLPRFSELNPPGVTMTNLPPFPWNHNTSYWHESRVSRDFRTRNYPEHELLGARVMDGNDLEPSWRKLLDVNSVSWLNDHVVSGNIVFPAAGYVAMIGAAIRQLSRSFSFTIRHLSIDAAMILRIGHPTEIITRLQPHRPRTKLHSSAWHGFAVSSYDGNKWVCNCSGEVRTGQNSRHNMFQSDSETSREVKSADWYRVGKLAGLEYGPSFQALQNIRCAVGRSVVAAEVRDDWLPKASSYAVHPIAIDQLLQCCIIGSVQGRLRDMKNLVLPIHISEVYVGAQEGDTALKSCTEMISRQVGSVVANGQIQAKNGNIVLQCREIQFRILDNVNTVDSGAFYKLKLLEWRPDIDLIDAKQLIRRVSDLTGCIELVEKLHILCSIETTRMLKNAESSKYHMKRFKEWNEQFVTTIRRHGSMVVQDTEHLFWITSEDRQALIRKLLGEALATPAKVVALALARVYDAVEEIFHGKTDVLALLLADNVLADIYNFTNMFHHERLFQLLGHSNPGMRILEIGAGTGGLTSTILPALNKSGLGCMFSTYTYTDISSGFFKAAKERFQEYPDLEYVKLDISQDLATQGLQLHSYDLVIAANVLHATPNLHETLTNCRSLLRPRGRLLLLELCSEAKFINFLFGFFPGWWLGESDGRPNEPYLQPAQWDTALRRAGFASIEASITDQAPPYQLDAMIIARVFPSEVLPRKRLSFLVSDPSVVNARIQTIQSYFESDGYDVSLCSLRDLPSNSMDVVSLLDIEGPTSIFQDLSEPNFKGLIHLFRQCHSHRSKILWLTGPAQISAQNPHHAMVLGLARTLRLELGSVFATIELDPNDPNIQWNSIAQVFRKLQARGNLVYSSMDYEYALVNGNICIPRFVTSSVDGLLRHIPESTQVTKRLFITKPGLLDTLQWGLQSRRNVLRDNGVEIEVRSASLNSWDFGVAMDITQSKLQLGLECAGLITRTGENAKHNFQLGDFVLCWSPGSLASHVQVDANYCVKLPDGLPFVEAATLLTGHATMIRGLKELCNLEQGESILIHSGAGADGIAAIQIARIIGAKIFVTVATDEQEILLETKYRIPRSSIFSSKDDSFVSGILQSTNARGVDVVVNTLSGDLFFESWKCVAEGGSMIDLSRWDSTGRGQLDCGLLDGNRSFYSFDIVTLLQQKPLVAQRLFRTVLDLFKNGSIQPISPIAKFDPSEIKEAFHHLGGDQRIGAVCINFPQDPITFQADFYAEKIRFRGDRSYLLVGGFGGLGKAAAIWFAERGAGSIIFLSRSASAQATANANLLRELDAWGCSVQIVTGSVTDITTVENLVSNATKPIAGVLHLPIVSMDKPLLEMSHSDWQTPISAKVHGAWNLHHALQKQPLDFFVLLSSVYGVRGNHGQASYAAASSFLDAFVQYRQQQNLPASVIDLGPLDDIGHVAERPKLLDELRRIRTPFLKETDFLESLELAIQASGLSTSGAPSITSSFINRAQFVVGGIPHPLDARGQGLARIFEGSKNDFAAEEETSLSLDESNKMQRFMRDVKRNPKSLDDDPAVIEAFLAAQIFEALKSLLIFEDGDDTELNDSSTMSGFNVDSLVAIELQNWWRQSMGTQVGILELTQGTSALELGKVARSRLLEALSC